MSFSQLGADEYKWDWEGKFVDEAVVERLWGEYFDYFTRHPLGQEKFLTFRLPNPKVETEFRLSRAFMGILGAAVLAREVGVYSPPLFEVILPMTESASEMIAIQEAFAEVASLKHPILKISNGTLKEIQIIPLFEQVSTIISSDAILDEYLKACQLKFDHKPEYLRPYVARSDPALNSGLVACVLSIKIALSRYRDFENQKGVKLYPIIGSACLPFRGGLTPYTVHSFAKQYQGIKTALLQSAFRYDYPQKDVIKAIKQLTKILPEGVADHIYSQEMLLLKQIINTFELFYRTTVEGISEPVNELAKHLPKRRERFQHIGLFGYSRGVGRVKLPRAIGFTASLYSLGVPPEFIGIGRGIKHIKDNGKIKLLEKYYPNLKNDLIRAGAFLNKKNLSSLTKTSTVWEEIKSDICQAEKYLKTEFGPRNLEEKKHCLLTNKILKDFQKDKIDQELLTQAALLRKSLG